VVFGGNANVMGFEVLAGKLIGGTNRLFAFNLIANPEAPLPICYPSFLNLGKNIFQYYTKSLTVEAFQDF
jgi:hypothetical protein